MEAIGSRIRSIATRASRSSGSDGSTSTRADETRVGRPPPRAAISAADEERRQEGAIEAHLVACDPGIAHLDEIHPVDRDRRLVAGAPEGRTPERGAAVAARE